jgi:hypothetical protein
MGRNGEGLEFTTALLDRRWLNAATAVDQSAETMLIVESMPLKQLRELARRGD